MPRKRIPIQDIVTVREIAVRYETTESAVHQWFRRYAGAPEPFLSIGTQHWSIGIYDLQDVRIWLERNGPQHVRRS